MATVVPPPGWGREVFLGWPIFFIIIAGGQYSAEARFGVRIRIFCFIFRCASISLPAKEKEEHCNKETSPELIRSCHCRVIFPVKAYQLETYLFELYKVGFTISSTY